MAPKAIRQPTFDEFVECVTECMDRYTSEGLLQIPGVWEAVSEEFNNEALELWEAKIKARRKGG